MGKWRDKQSPLAFLLGAAGGAAYGYFKAKVAGAVFGALVGGALALGLVWWAPIGLALVVVLVAFVLMFLMYGAFWSAWLK